ncbi:MAG: DUF1835 domain-containing protein [Pseudomonadota bacterium]
MAHVIVLGDGGAAALAAAGHGAPRAHRDELSFGPLPDLTSEAFAPARARYWSEVLGDAAAHHPVHDGLLEGDVALRAEVFGAAETVQVWASESLQDCMFLAACASLARPGARLTLRRPGPGPRPPVAGIGGVAPEQLRAPAPPHPLSEAEVRGLRRFWAALTAPSVDLLRAFAAAPPPSPSGLGAAAAARLARLPHPVTGLTSVEAGLLTQIAELGSSPPSVARVIGGAMAAGAARPDRCGDLSFHHALRELADPALPRPLAALEGDGSMRGSTVRLTDFGAEALAGRADRVATNGWRIELGGLSLRAPPGADVPRAPPGADVPRAPPGADGPRTPPGADVFREPILR